MDDIKWIRPITCTQCERLLSIYHKQLLVDFIKQRKLLPRCQGCRKILEYEKQGGKYGK